MVFLFRLPGEVLAWMSAAIVPRVRKERPESLLRPSDVHQVPAKAIKFFCRRLLWL
jgi:hypothetical protein